MWFVLQILINTLFLFEKPFRCLDINVKENTQPKNCYVVSQLNKKYCLKQQGNLGKLFVHLGGLPVCEMGGMVDQGGSDRDTATMALAPLPGLQGHLAPTGSSRNHRAPPGIQAQGTGQQWATLGT